MDRLRPGRKRRRDIPGVVRDGNVAGTEPASPSQSPQIVIFCVSSLSRLTWLVRTSLLDHLHVHLVLVRRVHDLDRPQPWCRTSAFERQTFARGTSLGEDRTLLPVLQKCLQAVHRDSAACLTGLPMNALIRPPPSLWWVGACGVWLARRVAFVSSSVVRSGSVLLVPRTAQYSSAVGCL